MIDKAFETMDMREFILPLKVMMDLCHANSKASGWWTDPVTGLSLIPNTPNDYHDLDPFSVDEVIMRWFPYVIGTKIALIHSEISEALEAYRVDAWDDKLPQYKGIAVESVDALIRIGDLMGCLGMTGEAAEAFVQKMAFNVTRPDHQLAKRQQPNGKRF
jgi:hypothetical protein